MVKAVLLLKNGDIKDIEIKGKPSDLSSKTSSKLINNKFISKYLENLGTGAIKMIEKWDIDSNYKLQAFGYIKGKELNNHELPPSIQEEIKLYGDILIIKVNSQELIIDITSEEYEMLYNNLFGNVSGSEYDSELDNLEGDGEEEDIEDDEESDEENDGEGDDNEIEEDDSNELIDDMETDMETDMENPIVVKTKIKTKIKSKKKTEENELPDLMEPCEIDDTLDLSNELILTDDEDESDNYQYELRIKIRGLFDNLDLDVSQIKQIEKGIFNYTCKSSEKRKIVKKWENNSFKKIYLNKARSLYSNINPSSYINNKNLINKLNNNEMKLNNLAFMTPQEIFPEHWKKMMDEKYNRDKYLYESVQEAMTDQFKCSRCKSRKCTYYEMQTRSADEGMTLFVTCLTCGRRWKQ